MHCRRPQRTQFKDTIAKHNITKYMYIEKRDLQCSPDSISGMAVRTVHAVLNRNRREQDNEDGQ